ncbi:MAG: fasciclin domain-containing protein, partial [Chitinophagaceae bacterium]|nr:fasciclin domain-containing protein [Chitinophagaceae bacterium]
ENGGVSTVVATDLKAENGLVHVIDTVVLPK